MTPSFIERIAMADVAHEQIFNADGVEYVIEHEGVEKFQLIAEAVKGIGQPHIASVIQRFVEIGRRHPHAFEGEVPQETPEWEAFMRDVWTNLQRYDALGGYEQVSQTLDSYLRDTYKWA